VRDGRHRVRRLPGACDTGFEVSGLDAAAEVAGTVVLHPGTAERGGRVVTSRGRVLAVSGLGSSLAEARCRAYDACSRIGFEAMYHRTDVAERAAAEGVPR